MPIERSDGAASARGARSRVAGARASAGIAALAALGLGGLAASMMVVGHQRWEGRVLVAVSSTHGIHVGDLWALVPVVVGSVLALWCWRQRSLP